MQPQQKQTLLIASQLKTLGHAQIWIGLLLIIVGSVQIIFEATIYNSYGFVAVGASIWGGIFVVISGCLARAAFDRPSKCHVIGGLTMGSISMVTNLAQFGFEVTGLVVDHWGDVRITECSDDPYWYCWNYYVNGPLTGLMILHTAAVILGTASFACTTSQVVYLAKETNRQQKSSHTVVHLNAIPAAYNPTSLPQTFQLGNSQIVQIPPQHLQHVTLSSIHAPLQMATLPTNQAQAIATTIPQVQPQQLQHVTLSSTCPPLQMGTLTTNHTPANHSTGTENKAFDATENTDEEEKTVIAEQRL